MTCIAVIGVIIGTCTLASCQKVVTDLVVKFLTEIVPEAVKKAKDTNATAIFDFGWDFMKFKDKMPTRQQLDAICSDIPMFFGDE